MNQVSVFFNGNNMSNRPGKRQSQGPLTWAYFQNPIRVLKSGEINNLMDDFRINQEMLSEPLFGVISLASHPPGVPPGGM
jgi:hypothetical protein